MWILCAFGSAFFAGITSILAKIGIQKVNSHLATALRTAVVLVFAWLMVFLVGSQHLIFSVDPKSWLFLILSGFATGASWICFFQALQIGNVNHVVSIDKSSTVLTMLLAFVLLREPMSLNMILGMVLITSGTLLMLTWDSHAQSTASTAKGWLLWAVLSAFFASLTAILSKLGIAGVEPNLGNAIRTTVVLFMAWGIVFALGQQKEIGRIDRKSWLFLVLSGLATGFSWMFYYHALREGQASVVIPIDKLSILVTVAFSGILLKEKLSRRSVLGLLSLTLGTLLLLFPF